MKIFYQSPKFDWSQKFSFYFDYYFYSFLKQTNKQKGCGLIYCGDCTNQFGIIDKPALAKKFEQVRLCSPCFEKEQGKKKKKRNMKWKKERKERKNLKTNKQITSDTPQTEVIKDTIWVQDGVAGKLRFVFPTKMTIVKLRSGALFIHSPLELTGLIVLKLKQMNLSMSWMNAYFWKFQHLWTSRKKKGNGWCFGRS